MNLKITTTGRIVVLVTFVAYIIAVTLIGVFANRAAKKQAAEGYTGGFFAGGRGLGGLALGMMMATLLSSGTFVSSHGMIYKIGLSYATICLVAYFSLILSLGGTGKKIGIIGRRTGVVSFIGLLKNRYNGNKALVVVLALPMVIFLVCYSASQVVGGARVFEVMTGGSYWVGLLLFGAVIGVYTLLGGMKSVAATSIFQGLELLLAVVAEHQAGEHIALSRCRSAVPLLPNLLHLIKDFQRDNCWVGVIENLAILYRIFPLLLVPDGVGIGLEIDRAAGVLHVFKDVSNSAFMPAILVLWGLMRCFSALPLFVGGGVQHLFLFQQSGDLAWPFSLHAECKDPLHNLCSLLVNHPFLGIVRVTFIAVGNVGGQAFSTLTFCLVDGTDFSAGR